MADKPTGLDYFAGFAALTHAAWGPTILKQFLFGDRLQEFETYDFS